MNRRHFLYGVGGTVASAILLGRVWQGHARTRLQRRLEGQAASLLASKARKELQRMPAEAREQMQTWFHAPCLNAAEFAREICSLSFLERLRAHDDPALRDQAIANAFTAKVVSEAEILNGIQGIAQEVGADLDRRWSGCCQEITASWNLDLQLHGSTLPAALTGRFDDMIRAKLREAIQAARDAGELPSVGETVSELGRTALLLLRLEPLPAIAIPVFLFQALRPLTSFLLSRINSPAEDLQAAVSDRLAVLAIHVGAGFEAEVRNRIVDLHRWQSEVLAGAAQDLAK